MVGDMNHVHDAWQLLNVESVWNIQDVKQTNILNNLDWFLTIINFSSSYPV